MIPTGLRTEQILIETPVATADELGQTDRSWTTDETVWAQVMQSLGKEFLSGDYQAEGKAVFNILWRAMDSTARVTWNARVYRIDATAGTQQSGELWLYCTATDGAN